MSKGLVNVLGTAAPEVVEVVAPVVYDAISSGPRWMTKQKVKAIVSDVQVTTMQIHALKKIMSEEFILKKFLYTELSSSISLLQTLELPQDAVDVLIKQAIDDCLDKVKDSDFSSGFRTKYKSI